MTIPHTQAYRDPVIAKSLIHQLKTMSTKPIRLMEVCGTHTMAIFKHGIRSLLPDTVTLLSGPGCPVCVTCQGDIDAFVALSRRKDITIATFGDVMRVPGSGSSLQRETAEGADVRVVYSPMDALNLAKDLPERNVVFLAVGFETTAPTIAAVLFSAQKMKLKNFFVYCAHKTVPAALTALMDNPSVKIDGLLLPGHVSVIIGVKAYRPFHAQYQIPCVVAGFEPVDVLHAIVTLVDMFEKGNHQLRNLYPRAVTVEGNLQAQQMMTAVFEPCDAIWRGLGGIPASGLAINPAFIEFDAVQHFGLDVVQPAEPEGCACGEILSGIKTPAQCPLFGKQCTTVNPVGPCMVSSEGTCAAYYRYSAFTKRKSNAIR